MFKFKYRRKLFWRTHIVTGFSFKVDMDRIALYFKDGGIIEIAQWSKCDCKLGKDYFDYLHKKMEREAGQAIPVNKGDHA